MSSNFDFLAAEWKSFYKLALEAGQSVNTAPRLCVFFCRYNLKQVTVWFYNNHGSLMRPYRNNLAFLVHEHIFKGISPPHLFNSALFLWQTGNISFFGDNKTKSILLRTVLITLKHLYLFLTWFAMIYSEDQSEVPEFNGEKGYEEKIYDDDSDSLSEWTESPEITFSTVNIANYREKIESYIRQCDDNIKTYIEVISFDKLLLDAKRRNQVLFERLGLKTYTS